MRNITKIIAGAGIAVAALGTVAMPATAADTAPTTATQATGDRLEGPLQSNTWGTVVDEDGFLFQKANTAPGDIFSIPAFGETGEVRSGGKCLTSPAGGGFLRMRPCDGSASQQFGSVNASYGYLTIGGISNAPVVIVAAGFNAGQLASGGTNVGPHGFDKSKLVEVGAEVVPVSVTGPVSGSTLEDTTPSFTGTGEPGAAIVVTDADGNELCSTTVAADGTWSCDSTVELPMGPTTVTVEQTDANGDTTSDTVDFTIALPAPLVAPGIAALALGALGAGVLVKRRKK